MTQPCSLDKHQSTESASNTVGGCGWIELNHQLSFPDDNGQIQPASETHYRVIGANGSLHEGQLDASGSATLNGVGHGSVTIDYEPNIDNEIRQLQEEAKQILEELVEAERQETQRIEREYNESNWVGRRWKDTKAVGSGLWNFVTGIFGALWGILKGVGSALSAVTLKVGEYVLDPLNAPETFEQDVEAIQEQYEALQQFATEDLETYFLFMSDEQTWGIFEEFGKDYLDAQHYSEYISGGTEAVLGVILTVLTAGAGAAAAAGAAGGRLAAVANKLAPVVKKLADLLKRKRGRTQQRERSNQRVATVTVLRRRTVPCFCAQNSNGYNRLNSDSERQRYLSDYQRQLNRQQDGINNMTIDEYRLARDAYRTQGRNPVADAMQESTRRQAREDIQSSILRSLIGKPDWDDFEVADIEATNRTSEIMDKLAALHDPDMVSGGWHNPMPTGMGNSSINSSIGSSWNQKDRLGTIDSQMNEVMSRTNDINRGQSKMNIQLEVCRSRRECP